ncbi:methyl-accepting chemotaxis protein [Kineosporia succinea]|uniref:Methyl-accepting chemotaxis protein n=1 Tax=Kineosporia succinea TaxID=84632 RepID=A0ABT9P105_9ACTN|nr:methyl-accepting chemotaxis protein [Kineosporia succinea]MDP9826246.1 methyl-accepting chemotaxis protein [Kineosporia succinea]
MAAPTAPSSHPLIAVSAVGALFTGVLPVLGAPSFAPIAAGVLVAAGAVVLGRNLNRSVSRLDADAGAATRALTSGSLNLKADAEHPVSSSVAVLGSTLRPLGPAVDLLVIAGQEMSAAGATISDGAQDTSGNANQIAESAADVSRNVAAMAAAGEQMQAAIAEISRSAAMAAETAASGVNAVGSAVTTMGALEQSSARVGDIVKTITTIAEQTNLLALNATIEAARAGDAGKGFAVVAEEVKQLAQETARATEEIGNTVQQIQGDSSHAIQAIHEIRTIIDRISEFQQSIATAVEEQTLTTQQLTQTTAEVAGQAESIAGSVAVVADRSTSTTTAAVRNHKAVSEVARLAGELKAVVSALTLPEVEIVAPSYSIGWDRPANRLDIALRGNWDLPLATTYANELKAAFLENKPGWKVLCDMSQLGATTPEVQAQIEGTMARAAELGIGYAVILLDNPLVAMQMQRSSDATGAPIGYATNKSDGLAILAQH